MIAPTSACALAMGDICRSKVESARTELLTEQSMPQVYSSSSVNDRPKSNDSRLPIKHSLPQAARHRQREPPQVWYRP
jgi:hypothetical protein